MAIATPLLFLAPKPLFTSNSNVHNPTLPLSSTYKLHSITQPKRKLHTLSAATAAVEDALPSVEKTQQIVSSYDDGSSKIISALLITAFIGLSLLTIGVVYLAVQEFLQKREKDKFEKEEAEKKKRKGGKKKVKARTGPRGFGQKIEEDDDFL